MWFSWQRGHFLQQRDSGSNATISNLCTERVFPFCADPDPAFKDIFSVNTTLFLNHSDWLINVLTNQSAYNRRSIIPTLKYVYMIGPSVYDRNIMDLYERECMRSKNYISSFCQFQTNHKMFFSRNFLTASAASAVVAMMMAMLISLEVIQCQNYLENKQHRSMQTQNVRFILKHAGLLTYF